MLEGSILGYYPDCDGFEEVLTYLRSCDGHSVESARAGAMLEGRYESLMSFFMDFKKGGSYLHLVMKFVVVRATSLKE